MKLYKCRPRNFCFHYIFEINLVKFSHSFMHRDECGHFSLFQAQSSRHSQCIQNIFFSEMMALDVLWKRYIPNYLFLNQVYMKKAVFFWHGLSLFVYLVCGKNFALQTTKILGEFKRKRWSSSNILALLFSKKHFSYIRKDQTFPQ